MHFKIAAAVFSVVLWIAQAAAHPLERGVALTDPELMAELERDGFGLGALIQGRVRPAPSGSPKSTLVEIANPIENANLFRIRALTAARQSR